MFLLLPLFTSPFIFSFPFPVFLLGVPLPVFLPFPLFSLPDPVPLRMFLSGCPSPGALLGVPLPVFLPVSIFSFTEIHTASRRESVVGLSGEPLKHDSALCGTRPRVGKRSELLYRYPIGHLPRFPFLTFLHSRPIYQSDPLALQTDSPVMGWCFSDPDLYLNALFKEVFKYEVLCVTVILYC